MNAVCFDFIVAFFCTLIVQLAVLAGDFLLSRACVALASLKNTEVYCTTFALNLQWKGLDINIAALNCEYVARVHILH